jgi:hypothetical protein
MQKLMMLCMALLALNAFVLLLTKRQCRPADNLLFGAQQYCNFLVVGLC